MYIYIICCSSGVVEKVLAGMQSLPIVSIVQKDGGTQIKLIIDFKVCKLMYTDNIHKIQFIFSVQCHLTDWTFL